ncbi:MAG: FMN-binding protein [Candidatus Sericytochromatia bacterium]
MKKLLALFICFFTFIGSNPSFGEEKPEYLEQVYLTEKQAVDLVFKDLKVEKKQFSITPEQKNNVQKRLKRKIKETNFSYYVGKKGNENERYAWVLDEQGKHFPMTFIVSINKNLVVEQVAIMVYREKKGDEVKRKRFLNQFIKKSVSDPIEVDNDIIHITGATISSWSISAGVKKALVLTDELLKNK